MGVFMRVFLGFCLYILDIPVIFWLYYRCLEREPLVWKRGRYPLLVLHICSGVWSILDYLGKGPADVRTPIKFLMIFLIVECFFLANILWAKKGMGAFAKTSVFLGIFRIITLGIPLEMERRTLEGLGRLPVEADYIPAVVTAVMLEVVSFFLAAWILNRRLLEKLPALITKLLAGIFTCLTLVYSLGSLTLEKQPEFLLAASLFLAAGAAFILLRCQKQAIRREAYYFRQQARVFEDYSVALDRQNTIVRQVSYDMSTYLADMKRLAKNGADESMDEATWKMQQEYGKLAFVEYSNNRSVNAILQRKLEVCRARKIRTQIDLTQFDGGFVENTDWLGIFFCLFENAIEACVRMEPGLERFIRVKAQCASGFEVIVVLNSKQPGQKSGNGRHTTKGSSYEYGVGLHILEELVGKYGGSVICREEEDTFQTTISLQVRDKRRGRTA